MQASYQINDFMENNETGQKFLLNGNTKVYFKMQCKDR